MSRVQLVQGLPGTFGGMEQLEDEPPVSWLIRNWLAARELSVLYGKGGTFKSYVALGWSLQLAGVGVPCMYVAAEGTSGLRSRVEAWMAARGTHGKVLPHWHYYNANVHVDEDREIGTWAGALERYFQDRKLATPQLVVLDTMARNFAGDESSPKDVGMFIEGCEYLRRELDTAVLVIHHMGVSTGRERGSAALRNATFAMFKTANARYNSKGGGSVEIECDRMKDAPMPSTVRVQIDTVALDANEYGDVHRLSHAMRLFPPKGRQEPRRGVING